MGTLVRSSSKVFDESSSVTCVGNSFSSVWIKFSISNGLLTVSSGCSLLAASFSATIKVARESTF